eukprot:3354853-Lingulodinium_polyedra.AAC.1
MNGVVHVYLLAEHRRKRDGGGGPAQPRGEPPPQGRGGPGPEDEDFELVVHPVERSTGEPAFVRA